MTQAKRRHRGRDRGGDNVRSLRRAGAAEREHHRARWITGNATLVTVAGAVTAGVDLDGLVVTGTTGRGIGLAAIDGDAAVTVSRTIIDASTIGIAFADAVGSTATTEVHNTFVLNSRTRGVLIGAPLASRVELFQNVFADGLGDGIQIADGVDIGAGNLVARLNFLPGAGFDHGNLGFGFDNDGTGTPDIEFNWWGSAFLADIQGTIGGAPVPALVLFSGADTNVVPPAALADTGLDPFGFQQDAFGPPNVPAGPAPVGFAAQALLLDVLTQSLFDDSTPGDQIAERSGADVANVYDNLFTDPYTFLADAGLSELAPAGGESCALVAIPGGTRLTCSGGGGGLPGLSPASGGRPGAPSLWSPGIDPGLTLEDLLDMWLYNFGLVPGASADAGEAADQQATRGRPDILAALR